ncbi:TfoX/Sxy family protein [Kaistia dalseonensis]|uniref:DNA transformation protein n=1 Tax=Kaistia dalseonensis TaxID=410840 RepID=A0ABU0H1A0_9HYPH|nr:TfoX/Sxy family protein [Kaistia dalseonensis]MCX5493525.1 TfoX/Sxy family protein [Kaistia dalseonensis]MDQ0436085.1 DNA transformation protein [Kaistia dalseonensis]
MSADDEFLAELFEPVGRVTFRRMFGGLGIYRDGLMFGLVAYETVHLKADDTTRQSFEAEGCLPFSYDTKDGKRTLTSYWRIPERLLDEPDELRDWALAAVEVAIRANAAKPARKRK